MELSYEVLKSDPIAVFFYRGKSHSHPVRRDVALISTNKDTLVGYEIREGSALRDLENAPVKTYRKDRIPKWGDYWRLRRYGNPSEKSTLKRYSVGRYLKKYPR